MPPGSVNGLAREACVIRTVFVKAEGGVSGTAAVAPNPEGQTIDGIGLEAVTVLNSVIIGCSGYNRKRAVSIQSIHARVSQTGRTTMWSPAINVSILETGVADKVLQDKVRIIICSRIAAVF